MANDQHDNEKTDREMLNSLTRITDQYRTAGAAYVADPAEVLGRIPASGDCIIPLAEVETGTTRPLAAIGRDVCAAAYAAQRAGQVTYLTEDGQRLAMIMPLPGKD